MLKLWKIFIFAMIFVFLSEKFSYYEYGSLGEKKYLKKDRFFYIIMAVVVSVFVGLRTWYNDTPTYIMSYEMMPANGSVFDGIEWELGENPGFNLVNSIMRHLGVSTQSFLMVYAIVTNGLYLWFIRKYTDNMWFSVFLFFTMGIYTFTMAAIKQCVAVAICMIATDCVIRKKWVPFVFWIAIASTFHPYALMYGILPLVAFKPWTGYSYLLLIIFAFVGYFLESLLGTVVDITTMIGEEFNEASFSGEGVNVFRLAVVWVPVIISFVTRKFLRKSQDRAANVIINLSMLNAEIMFVALFGTANYFARLANYFLIFQTISLPYLCGFFEERGRKLLISAAVVCYLLYFYYANGINQPFDSQFASVTFWQYLSSLK